MMPIDEIAERAAHEVIQAHDVPVFEDLVDESAITTLAWELANGDSVNVETALRELVARAVEADRAQRDPNADGTLHGAAIIACLDRANNWGVEDEEPYKRAAQWIEENPDDFWDRYAGPMLDDIERERPWEEVEAD